jgi:hypothetical protein
MKPGVSGGRLDPRPAAPSDEKRQRDDPPGDAQARYRIEAEAAAR